MKAWFLKLHRWLALAFALPLAVVLVTGLILSFEPWLAARAVQPGTLTPARIEQLLARHDPQGQARAIAYRSYDNTLTIGGRGQGKIVDAASGEARPGPSGLASFLVTSRRLHETLLLDAGWLVVASTVVMLALVVLGALMGWPRIRNTLGGWHKAMGWGLLPLMVLSPLTGIFIAAGVTFTGPPPAAAPGPAPRLAEAVRVLGAQHDLSGLVWLRPQGGRLLARLIVDGEYRVYAVTKDGAVPTPRNWPRLWHEGNFAGWAAWMNAILSVAMIGLLVTGPWIWLRRKLRHRASRTRGAAATA
ncbi:MAG: PepSY-associated TM helix domain-containing protein [Alphaproteobacteria bacterium]